MRSRSFTPHRSCTEDIYTIGYPDPLHNEHGELCPVLIDSGLKIGKHAGAKFEDANGEGEVTWAEHHYLARLMLLEDTSGLGRFIIPSGFETHGYCSTSSWFVHAARVLAKGQDYRSYTSILHPEPVGQTAIADKVLGFIKPALFPAGRPRTPRQAAKP